MSHVARVDLVINDLDAVETAAARLGLELVRNQSTYRWFGEFLNDSQEGRRTLMAGYDPSEFGKCEHALRVKGDDTGRYYEIGLCKRKDGQPGWELLYDNWGPGQQLEKLAGAALGKMRDQYAASVTTIEMQQLGYMTELLTTPEGKLQVVAMKA